MQTAQDQQDRCRLLMAAIFKRALHDARDQKGPPKRRREALEWILSDGQGYELPFPVTCGFLGLDPTLVREQLLRETAVPECVLPPDVVLSDQLQYGHGPIFAP